MKTYAVDFETYYDKKYSVTTMGVDKYCSDLRFDPYMVAIDGPDVSYAGAVESAPWGAINGARWVSHNARFDETVWEHITGLPESRPAVWECTADLSVYLGCPRSLGGASEQLLGVTLSKEVREEMQGKHWFKLDDETKARVLVYAKSDAVNCLRLWEEHSHKWPEHERRVSRINRACGKFGVNINQPLLEEGINKLVTLKWEAAKLIPWEWAKTPLAPTKLKEACRKAKIEVPKSLAQDSPECAEWEDKYGADYPWVDAMRTWRRANILLKRLETIKMRLRPDGTFPFSIKYFGGHTGRFSGDGGFNIQNMPKGEMFCRVDENKEPIAGTGVDLRELIIPRKGKQFTIADLAQIEARITLWLARDFATLEQVAQGLSVYEAHAIASMGWDHADGELKKKNPKMYALAKARVLGLGFGCGAPRFKVLAAAPPYNLDFTDEESGATVEEFRRSNPKIVGLWKELQRDCGRSSGGDFEVELPSGRTMRYLEVRTYPKLSAEICKGERRVHLYGGKLAENIVQAVARDVFVEGLLRLHDAGYRILFHVHDEYVLETDAGSGTEEVQALVEPVPEWLPKCPIGAEIVIADRYLK